MVLQMNSEYSYKEITSNRSKLPRINCFRIFSIDTKLLLLCFVVVVVVLYYCIHASCASASDSMFGKKGLVNLLADCYLQLFLRVLACCVANLTFPFFC